MIYTVKLSLYTKISFSDILDSFEYYSETLFAPFYAYL